VHLASDFLGNLYRRVDSGQNFCFGVLNNSGGLYSVENSPFVFSIAETGHFSFSLEGFFLAGDFAIYQRPSIGHPRLRSVPVTIVSFLHSSDSFRPIGITMTRQQVNRTSGEKSSVVSMAPGWRLHMICNF